MNTIESVQLKKLPLHLDNQGFLVAFDSKADLQIDLRRVFVVSGHENARRGNHAHKALTQFLVCVSGECRVVCDDGKCRRETILDSPDQVLKVPKHIWAEQYYVVKDTVLLVFCDQPFNEEDYIRNYDDFLLFRNREMK